MGLAIRQDFCETRPDNDSMLQDIFFHLLHAAVVHWLSGGCEPVFRQLAALLSIMSLLRILFSMLSDTFALQ